MARSQEQRQAAPSMALRLIPVALVAAVTGFVFGGTGLEIGPAVAARESAERAAAVRVMLDLPPVESETAAAAVTPQQFLAEGERIVSSQYATRVRIESVGIDAEVASVGYVFKDGRLQYDVPRSGAGQYTGTAAPGQQGNTVIAGHVSNRSGPAVFRDLSQVGLGETIEVFRGDQVFRYEVVELRLVPADAVEVMQAAGGATVTLITCAIDDNFKDRFVVIGKLI
ncbi:MAG: class F sortase [Dehalococcoidia bacterium]